MKSLDIHAHPPEHASLVLDEDAAVERIGDRSIYLEIAHYFSSHMRQTIASLAGSLENGDTDAAMRLAHSLKGNCATVGADIMRERCYALEKLCRDEQLEEARNIFVAIAPNMLALGEKLALLE